MTHICEVLGRFLHALVLVHCDAQLGEPVHKAGGPLFGLLLGVAQDQHIVDPPAVFPLQVVQPCPDRLAEFVGPPRCEGPTKWHGHHLVCGVLDAYSHPSLDIWMESKVVVVRLEVESDSPP